MATSVSVRELFTQVMDHLDAKLLKNAVEISFQPGSSEVAVERAKRERVGVEIGNARQL